MFPPPSMIPPAGQVDGAMHLLAPVGAQFGGEPSHLYEPANAVDTLANEMATITSNKPHFPNI